MHKDDIYDRPVVKLFLKYGYRVVDVKRGDIVSEQAAQQKEKPAEPKEEPPIANRRWREVYRDFRKEIPEEQLDKRVQQGKEIVYVSWPNIIRHLHRICPGWSYETTLPVIAEDFVTVKSTLLFPCADGVIKFEALGTEPLFEYRKPRNGEPADEEGFVKVRTIGYGAAVDRAEASALRRAAAKAGFCIYLWAK